MARVEMFQHGRVALQPNDGVSDIQPQRDWNGNSHVQKGILGFLGTAVTLSSQTFVATDSLHVVAAQSGTSDTLATITATNSMANDWIQLTPASGHTITVSHGTGNIFLQGAVNKVLDAHVGMILRYDGTNWYEWGNYQSAITSASNTFTKGQTISPVTISALTLNLPTGPTGSASRFIGAVNVALGTITFATTPQSGDYSTNRIDQATLVNPSAGTIPNAASLNIVGAPIASTNVTITNNYALRVQAGTTLLQATTMAGTLTMSSADIALAANKIKTTSYNLYEQTLEGVTALGYTSSVTNQYSIFSLYPNGTSRQAGIDIMRIDGTHEYLRILSDLVGTGEFAINVAIGVSGTLRPLNVYMNGTKLLSFDTANTITSYVQHNFNGTINPLTSAGTAVFGIDASIGNGGQLSINNASSGYPFSNVGNFTGMFILFNINTGAYAIVGARGGIYTIIAQDGSEYVTSATTGGVGAGKTGFITGGAAVQMYNNTGSNTSYNIMAFRIRASN